MSRWDVACPLEGICPECGTALEWCVVLNPDRNDLSWFIEHGPAGSIPRRTLPTILRAIVPPLFWRSVTIRHRTNPARAAWWLVGLTLVLHLLGAATGFATAWARAGPAVNWEAALNCVTFPIARIDVDAFLIGAPGRVTTLEAGWPPYVVPSLLFALAWPGLLVALPTSRRLAKLRPGHILRALILSLWWVPGLCLFRIVRNGVLMLEIFIARSQAAAAVPGLPPVPRLGPGGGAAFAVPGVAMPMPARLGDQWPTLIGVLLFAYLLGWWWCACRRGWNLHRAGLVWALLSFAAGLVAVAAAEWTDVLRR